MANMTFGVNLLPNNTGGQKTLGNSNQKWDAFLNQVNGQALGGLAFKNSLSVSDIPSLTGYKTTQTAITAPAAETNKWVSSIGQDANGNINTTYSVLNTSGTWSGTATKALQDGNGNEISLSYVKYSQGKAVDLSIEENLSILTIDEDAIRGIYFKQPTTCVYDGTAGIFYLATPDDDIVDFTQFAFKQYSASSSTKKFTMNSDIFTLPYTSFDKSTTNYYAILTTKTTTSIGFENNPIFFNDQGQPQACGDETATSTKKLEAISAAGKIGFYSNGTSTLGVTITTKDNITSFPIRMSSTTDSGVQLGIYKQINLRQNLVIWPSTASSVIGDIVFYRSQGGNEITNGTKTWGQGNFGRITYEGPYSENVNGENTAYTTSRFAFKQYSHSNSIANNYYDIFYLPSTSGNTGNHAYNILTSKYAVTIGQGGTGATTVSNAKANLGLGLNSVPQFQGLILHNQNDSAEYTNLTLNYIDDFTSNINLHEDGYLKIDIANLQNTSKYRGIKLDSEATINNALMFFDNSTNSIINYKIYHSGNIADLVNDLTPYFQSANGVSF